MELITKITTNKSQIDKVQRLELDNNVLKIYFAKSIKIGDEILDEVFDITSPITLSLEDEIIKRCLNTLYSEGFKERSKQLNISTTPEISIEPDYKGFYNALLISQIFSVVQGLTVTNANMNLAYTTFGLAITVTIAGLINTDGLQTSVNGVIFVLKDLVPVDTFQSLMKELKQLIELYRIPLNIEE